MKYFIQINLAITKTQQYSVLFLMVILSSCTPSSISDTTWENVNKEGTFIVYRRQSPIGEESYSITSNKDTVIIKSLQGENERGRITGVDAELHLTKNFVPIYYNNRRITKSDTTNIFKMEIDDDNEVSIWEEYFDVVSTKTPEAFFPLHSNIPAAMEMMLYHYYFNNNFENGLTTLPRGEVSITHKGKDFVEVKGEEITLDRYVVEGINWGGRTVWLDESKNLIALVKANTQIREIIRKGYEEAMPVFIAGNVTEQMDALSEYTQEFKKEQATFTALVGGDIIDGLSDVTKKDMTLLIENGRIKSIGKRTEIQIPKGAEVIDLRGKVLMPGLWDMHAHSNQVQWAPAYLAGGITTIRDNGNEVEFATAFRDAIDKNGALGPDILLAGMTDGPGVKGNGVIRATSVEQAKEVVQLYHTNGYKQIKIYTSIEPNILKVLADEAHKVGMSVTGHVPSSVGNAVHAIESGMDQLSHRSRILSVVFPEKNVSDLGRFYLKDNEVSPERINKATDFLLKHKTVLDPTIALDVVRALPKGSPLEMIEPDANRIAYELFEGKRFRAGVSSKQSALIKEDYIKGMLIIGDLFRAGVPIVAGTDNVVPVFSLYLEIETYQKFGKLTNLEAIQTATVIPAKAMGLDMETGTLEVGKQADIAILKRNPLLDIANIRTVTSVVSNGNYYESNPLFRAADFKPHKN